MRLNTAFLYILNMFQINLKSISEEYFVVYFASHQYPCNFLIL